MILVNSLLIGAAVIGLLLAVAVLANYFLVYLKARGEERSLPSHVLMLAMGWCLLVIGIVVDIVHPQISRGLYSAGLLVSDVGLARLLAFHSRRAEGPRRE